MNSPAFQFYPAEYLADESVQLLSLVEEGAYIRALSYCWREGSIPADPMKLSRLIGKECSQAIAEAILPLFEINTKDPSRLIHKRLEKERTKQQKFKKAMSESGKKGASARWDSQNKEWPGHSQAITRPMASDSSSSSSSISSSITSSITNRNKHTTCVANEHEGNPKPKTVRATTENKTEFAPGVFLTEAEHSGFITKFGSQFVTRCCEKLSAWIEQDPIPKRKRNGVNAAATFRAWVLNSVSEEESRASRTNNKTPVLNNALAVRKHNFNFVRQMMERDDDNT